MRLFPKLRSQLRNTKSQDDAELNRQTAKQMNDFYKQTSSEPKTLLDEENLEESKESMEEAGEKQRLWSRTQRK